MQYIEEGEERCKFHFWDLDFGQLEHCLLLDRDYIKLPLFSAIGRLIPETKFWAPGLTMLLLVDFFTSVVKALLKSVPLSKRPFLYWTWLTMDKILLDGNLNILMIKSQICWSEELSYKCSFCACSFVQLMAQITNAAPFKGSIAIFFADDESKSSVKCAWFVDGCSFFWDAPPISLCTQRPLNKQNCTRSRESDMSFRLSAQDLWTFWGGFWSWSFEG